MYYLDRYDLGRKVIGFNGCEEIFDMVVWICVSKFDSFFWVYCFDIIFWFKVLFDVYVVVVRFV